MTPPIAILGAGPSGLALGRLLDLAKFPYVIFERDESATSIVGQGGTLDLHTGSGQLALQEAGLFEQFKLLARTDATTILADAKGKVYARFGEDGNEDRPEIDRRDLRALLLSSVPPSQIRWGCRVQHVQNDIDGSISIHFTDGKIESGFRLVIGADGAWSKVRTLVTTAKPQYAGHHYLTTYVKPENPFHSFAASLVGPGNYMACGDGKQIAAQKLGDGSYHISVCLRLAEKWGPENAALISDPSAVRELLLQDHFADWPEVYTDFIKRSEGSFRDWPLYAMPTESLSWQSVPGFALIGDAAHVTTPFVGEGVNCALYDSVQLAQQISKYGLEDLNRAVSEYEKLMFPRAIALIKRSAESGELLFKPDFPRGWLQTFAGIESA